MDDEIHLKFFQQGDQHLGILCHFAGHADERHSVEQGPPHLRDMVDECEGCFKDAMRFSARIRKPIPLPLEPVHDNGMGQTHSCGQEMSD